MVSTLAWNANTNPIPALGTIFPIFITPMTLVVVTKIMYKLCSFWLFSLAYVYMCMATSCMYAIVSIKRLRLWLLLCVYVRVTNAVALH